jgi:hypothetical protein
MSQNYSDAWEKFAIDDFVYRVREWIEDSEEAEEVSAALEDYKKEVLTPTGAVVRDYNEWDDQHVRNFGNWVQSKGTLDDYFFSAWLDDAFDTFIESKQYEGQ